MKKQEEASRLKNKANNIKRISIIASTLFAPSAVVPYPYSVFL